MSQIDNEITSELRRGKTTTSIWQIKNWNTSDDLDFDVLKRKSNCFVNILSGSTLEGAEEHLNSRLRFYFEETVQRKPAGEDYESRYNYTEEHVWLKLCVNQLSNLGDRILQYEYDQVDDKLNSVCGQVSVKSRKEFFANYGGMEPIVLHDEFIHLQGKVRPDGQDTISDDTTATLFPRPATLRLKISVTPIFICGQSDCGSLEDVNTERETSLCEAIKNMFDPDIKLETKDHMTLSAHKFMLAARSPVLRDLIEQMANEQNFDGIIKLTGVDFNPMVAIRHWIYTGELHENTGEVMEKVVNAAEAFELNGLIKTLDRKLLTVCNKRNMFRLYQVAENNGMSLAVQDISKFIKESI